MLGLRLHHWLLHYILCLTMGRVSCVLATLGIWGHLTRPHHGPVGPPPLLLHLRLHKLRLALMMRHYHCILLPSIPLHAPLHASLHRLLLLVHHHGLRHLATPPWKLLPLHVHLLPRSTCHLPRAPLLMLIRAPEGGSSKWPPRQVRLLLRVVWRGAQHLIHPCCVQLKHPHLAIKLSLRLSEVHLHWLGWHLLWEGPLGLEASRAKAGSRVAWAREVGWHLA